MKGYVISSYSDNLRIIHPCVLEKSELDIDAIIPEVNLSTPPNLVTADPN
jgi:hypothetical protein